MYAESFVVRGIRGPYRLCSPRRCRRTVLRDNPVCRLICRIDSPCRANIRISTACSWVNIPAAQKAAILAQVGHFYFGAVGQFYLGVNTGACEIRVRDPAGVYRVIYVARFADVVYVLHAFHKKTQKTSRADLELATQRYRIACELAQGSLSLIHI